MSRPLRGRAVAALLLAGSLTVATGCAADPPPVPVLSGPVNVGVSSDGPAMAVFDRSTSMYSGFEIDFAHWLGRHASPTFEPKFVDVRVDRRIDELRGGGAKLIINTFSITDERRKVIDFAGPYLVTQQGVLIRTGDTSIRTDSDLAGKRICVQPGSTSLAQLQAGPSGQHILVHGVSAQDCADRLLANQVDAVTSDQLALYGFAIEQPAELDVVEGLTFGAAERYGIGLPNNSPELCRTLTELIGRFIADGTWDTHFRTYFGEDFDPAHYRPNPSELDRCEEAG